jgi:hypothetical protein
VDEQDFLAGRDEVADGYLHGVYGNPDGYYNHRSEEDKERYKSYRWFSEIAPRAVNYSGMDDTAGYSGVELSPKQHARYEDVVDLGFLSLREREVFPYLHQIGELVPDDAAFIDNDHGIKEGLLRGRGAVNRVMQVTSNNMELRAPVLSSLAPSGIMYSR